MSIRVLDGGTTEPADSEEFFAPFLDGVSAANRFGADEVFEFLGEVGIADGVVIHADNAQAIAQQAITAEVVQRRHQQALYQVTMGTKQKQGGGRSGFGLRFLAVGGHFLEVST